MGGGKFPERMSSTSTAFLMLIKTDNIYDQTRDFRSEAHSEERRGH